MGGALVVCDSIWTPSRSLLPEPKREASELKLQSQVPSPPTCTLPSLPHPPSHLLMLKDLFFSFCATAPARPAGPPGREPAVPVHQDLTVPASPSSCKPASPLGLGPYTAPQLGGPFLCPLLYLLNSYTSLNAQLARPLLSVAFLISCSLPSLLPHHVLWLCVPALSPHQTLSLVGSSGEAAQSMNSKQSNLLQALLCHLKLCELG